MNIRLKIPELLNQAKINLNNNKLNDAQKLYYEVIKIDPENYEAHNNLGVTYNKLGENQKAIDFYNKSIEINPNFIEGHSNLAVIFYNLGQLENSLKHHKKLLQLRSKNITTNSDINNVIEYLTKKLQDQNHVPTFFDNATISHITKNKNPNIDYCKIFQDGQNSKLNRFISFPDRARLLSAKINYQLFNGLPFLISQGVHSLINWKGLPLFKTTFDMAIYSMILQEIKPDIIIELGSGMGGSAIWLADITNSLGLKTHIYSFDINMPKVKHDKVTFINCDLYNTDELKKLLNLYNIKGKKIIIEDAHVNLLNILNFFDKILIEDDYLIIEDSESKQRIINTFTSTNNKKYRLDQFYLDFFGTNITSCINSIFKCF